jgi:CheY-like chemotaxis protein
MQKYEVYGARDGETAIDFINHKDFDAVISDYRMPGQVTGLEVLAHYHQRHAGRVKVPGMLLAILNRRWRQSVAFLFASLLWSNSS